MRLTATGAAALLGVALGGCAGQPPAVGVDGTYRALVTRAELVRAGVDGSQAEDNAGTLTLVLAGGRLTLDNQEHPPRCTGRYSVDGRRVRVTWDRTPGNCTGDGTMTWSADGDGLRLRDFRAADGPGETVDRVVWTGRTWRRAS